MKYLRKFNESIAKEEIEKDIIDLSIKYINYDGDTKYGVLQVNKSIAENTEGAFKDLYDISFPIYRIDKSYQRKDEDIIMDNITTGYNFRFVMGTDKLSKHAKGYAIDLNPKVNPAKPSRISHVYDESIEKGKITDEVINIFKKWGFKWGGEIFGSFWDSHHFEI
jgi:hypothetical protein